MPTEFSYYAKILGGSLSTWAEYVSDHPAWCMLYSLSSCVYFNGIQAYAPNFCESLQVPLCLCRYLSIFDNLPQSAQVTLETGFRVQTEVQASAPTHGTLHEAP